MGTDGVHCQESAGAGPASSPEGSSGRVLPWQFPHPLLVWSGYVESTGMLLRLYSGK